MKRFKKILFVYDPDSEETPAFERAVHLAEANQASLKLVHVLDEFPPQMQMTEMASALPELQKQIHEGASEALTRGISKIREKRLKVTGEVLWGTPFIEIIREVIRNDHDLVMVIPRKTSRVEEALFGSRIMHLMRKCPVPVWAFNPELPKRHDRVMAAVDVVPEDDKRNALNVKIMELASYLALMDKSELHVVYCWEPSYENTLRHRSGLSQEAVSNILDKARASHRQWLKALVAPFATKAFTPRIHLQEGEPDEGIPHFAGKKNIDLVVMGTVVRTGLSGFLIGNTAEKILHKIRSSVLAVKPDGFKTPVKLD